MGKYMRKAKTAGEVAVMDLALGVRTRSRTLALKKSSIPPSPSPSTASSAAASGSYLQLRSRRLQKPPIVVNDSAKRAKQGGPAKDKENCASDSQNQNPNSSNSNSRARVRVSQADSGSNASSQKNESNSNENVGVGIGVEEETIKDLGVEASFGENALEIEGRERGTRESTPCSLIRQPEAVRTPGSTTRPRPTSSTEGRVVRNSTRRQIPTAHEMNQFFAGAEEEQQRQFVEKYNFDPVNDKPLPGRFEWEKVNP